MIFGLGVVEGMNFGTYAELWELPSSTIRFLYYSVDRVIEERMKELKKNDKK